MNTPHTEAEVTAPLHKATDECVYAILQATDLATALQAFNSGVTSGALMGFAGNALVRIARHTEFRGVKDAALGQLSKLPLSDSDRAHFSQQILDTLNAAK